MVGVSVHVLYCLVSQAQQIGCVADILCFLCMFKPSVQHMYHRSDDALRVGHDAYMTQLLVIHFRIGNLEQDNGEHRNNAFHWDPLGRMLPLEEADFWFFHLLT